MEIRRARAGDVESVVALSGVVRPYAVGAPERLRREFAELEAGREEPVFAAEVGGRVVGWARLHRATWLREPDAYSLNLMVHPDHRRSGIGTGLYEACDAWLATLPSAYVQAFADEGGTQFARSLGFTAGDQMVYAGLQLTDLPVPWIPDGLSLVPLSRLEATDIYPVYRDTAADIPGGISFDVEFEWFCDDIWAGTSLDRELSLALVEDGSVVCFTLVDREDTKIWSDMTGTDSKWRGKGLAGLVKAAALAAAKDAGVLNAYTIMNQNNAPMLAINHRLGYRQVGLRTEVTRAR
ncbi:GNAT family N-acetyltransferase [Kribbella sp. NPDC055071]